MRTVFGSRGKAMTFEELDQALPNGFHDAKIEKIAVDYAQRSATITMHLLVGTPDSVDQDEYRHAILDISGLCYYAIDPPDPTYPFMRSGSPVNVAGYPEDPEKFPVLDSLLPVMPTGVTCYRFFVHHWNSFIHIAAKDVQVSWVEDGARAKSVRSDS
jgi:hypothetical protein